ncbi:hypothetical protein JMJ35_007442 [Cladonia borealis]|uniref:Uncharacterized protein n=1 Tax=Cladonia borealis TaxID=184061 RepID=A0AA39QVR1_9LECA|nr:hypothetical protein JMJ35_007442 [Cladonia borealis]
MSLYSSTHRHVPPFQQFPGAAGEPDPYFPIRTDSILNVWDCHEIPAPPPSPRCIPQRAFEPIDMHHLDHQIEAYKSTPLRRVVSADDVSENYEHTKEESDGEADDEATMVATSDAPSSRCSDTTLLSEIVSTRRRFRLPSRADRQQRPSTSAGGTSQTSSLNWAKQISAPVLSSSTRGGTSALLAQAPRFLLWKRDLAGPIATTVTARRRRMHQDQCGWLRSQAEESASGAGFPTFSAHPRGHVLHDLTTYTLAQGE